MSILQNVKNEAYIWKGKILSLMALVSDSAYKQRHKIWEGQTNND